MDWPQYAMIGILLLSFSLNLYRDGKNGGDWTDVFSTFFAFGLFAVILYAGGFFSDCVCL